MKLGSGRSASEPSLLYSDLIGLETGLQLLKNTQLKNAPEFKNLVGLVDEHYRDVRLAHLTGKPRDLQLKANEDTKFYSILVKMLCEATNANEYDLRKNLKRVYTWFLANKHVLYSGPKFGKKQQKLDGAIAAQHVLSCDDQIHLQQISENYTKHESYTKESENKNGILKQKRVGVPHFCDHSPHEHNGVLYLCNQDVKLNKQEEHQAQCVVSNKEKRKLDFKKMSSPSAECYKNTINPISSLVNPHTFEYEVERRPLTASIIQNWSEENFSQIFLARRPVTVSTTSRENLLRRWEELKQIAIDRYVKGEMHGQTSLRHPLIRSIDDICTRSTETCSALSSNPAHKHSPTPEGFRTLGQVGKLKKSESALKNISENILSLKKVSSELKMENVIEAIGSVAEDIMQEKQKLKLKSEQEKFEVNEDLLLNCKLAAPDEPRKQQANQGNIEAFIFYECLLPDTQWVLSRPSTACNQIYDVSQPEEHVKKVRSADLSKRKLDQFKARHHSCKQKHKVVGKLVECKTKWNDPALENVSNGKLEDISAHTRAVLDQDAVNAMLTIQNVGSTKNLSRTEFVGSQVPPDKTSEVSTGFQTAPQLQYLSIVSPSLGNAAYTVESRKKHQLKTDEEKSNKAETKESGDGHLINESQFKKNSGEKFCTEESTCKSGKPAETAGMILAHNEDHFEQSGLVDGCSHSAPQHSDCAVEALVAGGKSSQSDNLVKISKINLKPKICHADKLKQNLNSEAVKSHKESLERSVSVLNLSKKGISQRLSSLPGLHMSPVLAQTAPSRQQGYKKMTTLKNIPYSIEMDHHAQRIKNSKYFMQMIQELRGQENEACVNEQTTEIDFTPAFSVYGLEIPKTCKFEKSAKSHHTLQGIMELHYFKMAAPIQACMSDEKCYYRKC